MSKRQHPDPADTIRAEMARRRKTQQEVANHLGLSQAAVSRRLCGDTPFNSHELIAVADLLGVSVAVLFGEAVAA